MTKGLGEDDELERRSRKHEKIERTVVAIVLEEAIETKEGGEKHSDPQHCRPDPSQEIEVGPDPEGYDGDDGQKKDETD